MKPLSWILLLAPLARAGQHTCTLDEAPVTGRPGGLQGRRMLETGNSCPANDMGLLLPLHQTIHDLDQSNFLTKTEGFKATKTHMVLEFYAHWCGHCQAYAPEYERVSRAVETGNSAVTVARVACYCLGGSFNPICTQFGIQGFPAVYYGTIDDMRAVFSAKQTNSQLLGQLSSLDKGTCENTITSLNQQHNRPSRPTPFECPQEEHGPNCPITIAYDAQDSVGGFNDMTYNSARQITTVKRNGPALNAGVKVPNQCSIYSVAGQELAAMASGDPTPMLNGQSNDFDVVVECQKRDRPQEQSDRASAFDMEKALRLAISFAWGNANRVGNADAKQAMVSFLWLASEAFPSVQCRSSLDRLYRGLLHDANDAVWGLSWAQLTAGGSAWSMCDKAANFYDADWQACKGGSASTRGYTCGLWMTFHALTVNQPEMAVMKGLRAIRGYIRNFFNCSYCRDHFLEMAAGNDAFEDGTPIPPLDGGSASPISKADEVMWLWRAHNRVNERLGLAEASGSTFSGDCRFPKKQWPQNGGIPRCLGEYSSNTYRPYVTASERETWDFLNQFYRADDADKSMVALECDCYKGCETCMANGCEFWNTDLKCHRDCSGIVVSPNGISVNGPVDNMNWGKSNVDAGKLGTRRLQAVKNLNLGSALNMNLLKNGGFQITLPNLNINLDLFQQFSCAAAKTCDACHAKKATNCAWHTSTNGGSGSCQNKCIVNNSGYWCVHHPGHPEYNGGDCPADVPPPEFCSDYVPPLYQYHEAPERCVCPAGDEKYLARVGTKSEGWSCRQLSSVDVCYDQCPSALCASDEVEVQGQCHPSCMTDRECEVGMICNQECPVVSDFRAGSSKDQCRGWCVQGDGVCTKTGRGPTPQVGCEYFKTENACAQWMNNSGGGSEPGCWWVPNGETLPTPGTCRDPNPGHPKPAYNCAALPDLSIVGRAMNENDCPALCCWDDGNNSQRATCNDYVPPPSTAPTRTINTTFDVCNDYVKKKQCKKGMSSTGAKCWFNKAGPAGAKCQSVVPCDQIDMSVKKNKKTCKKSPAKCKFKKDRQTKQLTCLPK